jgi:sulfoxide reductase heme-binding subunit YedZ
MHAFLKSRWFKPLVFLLCALPAAALARATWEGDLGVNPVETLLHETGRNALMILLVTLAVTPLRRLTGWNRLQAVRRMLGLWAFFYACCHFLVYVVFDKLGEVRAIWADVIERPFIFTGMFALVVLLALALTSTTGMMRRLGRNWQRLHRLVYVAAISATVHFAWGQKADISEPLQWAAALALLLGIRLFWAVTRRRGRLAPGPVGEARRQKLEAKSQAQRL